MRKTLLVLFLMLGVVSFVGSVAFADNNSTLNELGSIGDDYTGAMPTWGYSSEAGHTTGAYYEPCPMNQFDHTECAAFGEDDAQTAGVGDAPSDEQESEGTIVDDLFTSVNENWTDPNPTPDGDAAWSGTLDQDLDLLFTHYAGITGGVFGPGGTEERVLIDEGLDQSLVYVETTNTNAGAIGDSTIEGLNGLAQRLVLAFQNNYGYTTTDNTGHSDHTTLAAPDSLQNDVSHVDQWVSQWLRDVESAQTTVGGSTIYATGISQAYSSWFERSDETSCGVDCSHTYKLGSDSVDKEVQKDFNNDHNPANN